MAQQHKISLVFIVVFTLIVLIDAELCRDHPPFPFYHECSGVPNEIPDAGRTVTTKIGTIVKICKSDICINGEVAPFDRICGSDCSIYGDCDSCFTGSQTATIWGTIELFANRYGFYAEDTIDGNDILKKFQNITKENAEFCGDSAIQIQHVCGMLPNEIESPNYVESGKHQSAMMCTNYICANGKTSSHKFCGRECDVDGMCVECIRATTDEAKNESVKLFMKRHRLHIHKSSDGNETIVPRYPISSRYHY